LRRKCFLKHVWKRKKEGTRWRERRCKQLLDKLKEKKEYWNLKRGIGLWSTRFKKKLWTCRKRDYVVN
jgi:predicted metal-binding protein